MEWRLREFLKLEADNGGGTGGGNDGGNGDGGDGGDNGSGDGGSGDAGGGGGATGGGADGGRDSDWRTALPDDIRNHSEIQNTPDLSTAAKRIIDQAAFASRSVRIPGEDASKEVKDAFYNRILESVPDLMRTPEAGDTSIYSRLGKPESADGYKVPEREGLNFDNKQTQTFRSIAHKYNLTQAQFEGVVSEMTDLNVQQAEAQQTALAESIQKLSTEWGPAYKERHGMVRQFAQVTNAPQELQELLAEGKVGYDTMNWMYGLVKQVSGEGGALKIQPLGETPAISSAEAKEKITEIRTNKEHPYWNKSAGMAHKAAKDKMRELYKIAFPEG